MKTSRAVFSEVQKKAGSFPFNIRCLEDEKRARMGLQEATQHSLVKPYDVVCVTIESRFGSINEFFLLATPLLVPSSPLSTSPSLFFPVVLQ